VAELRLAKKFLLTANRFFDLIDLSIKSRSGILSPDIPIGGQDGQGIFPT